MVEYGKEIDDAMDETTPEVDFLKGRCPRCGDKLEIRERVGATDGDGSPSEDDTLEEFYCRRCRVWWVDMETHETDFRSYYTQGAGRDEPKV